MTHKENEQQQEQSAKSIAIAKITFTFGMTEEEADEILNNPKGQIARKMRKYAYSLVKAAAKKFFESEEIRDNVTNCKDDK